MSSVNDLPAGITGEVTIDGRILMRGLNYAEPEDGCICAPGTCPAWETRAGLKVNDPDCPYHGDDSR